MTTTKPMTTADQILALLAPLLAADGTPRTDAAASIGWTETGECVPADDAREIERDLKLQNKRLARALEAAVRTLGAISKVSGFGGAGEAVRLMHTAASDSRKTLSTIATELQKP